MLRRMYDMEGGSWALFCALHFSDPRLVRLRLRAKPGTRRHELVTASRDSTLWSARHLREDRCDSNVINNLVFYYLILNNIQKYWNPNSKKKKYEWKLCWLCVRNTRKSNHFRSLYKEPTIGQQETEWGQIKLTIIPWHLKLWRRWIWRVLSYGL
jgi:hypothetical protein